MKISPREAILGVMAVAVAAFGITVAAARSRLDAWKDLRKRQGDILWDIERCRADIAERDKWSREFGDLSRQLPAYPADKKMVVHWLSLMDSLASKRGVKILRRDAGAEKKLGDVYELPIDCAWEGSLDGVVHFLLDLQSEGAMLDIRQLTIKPKGQRGRSEERRVGKECSC